MMSIAHDRPAGQDELAALAYAEAAARPCTGADARWAAETSPLDGGWVDGDDPTAIELWTVSALDHFNEHLDPAAEDPRWDDLAEQARWDDWTGRGLRPW